MRRDKFPEKVPFRLTRMLVNAMEVSGIEGSFRLTCEKVMSVLRENRDSLIAMLEAFVYDPLVSWRLLNTGKENARKSATPTTTPEKMAKSEQQEQEQQQQQQQQQGSSVSPATSTTTNNEALPPSKMSSSDSEDSNSSKIVFVQDEANTNINTNINTNATVNAIGSSSSFSPVKPKSTPRSQTAAVATYTNLSSYPRPLITTTTTTTTTTSTIQNLTDTVWEGAGSDQSSETSDIRIDSLQSEPATTVNHNNTATTTATTQSLVQMHKEMKIMAASVHFGENSIHMLSSSYVVGSNAFESNHHHHHHHHHLNHLENGNLEIDSQMVMS